MLIASHGPAMVRLLRKRRMEGFTLLELMVVVIIIMIAAMIAIPTLSDAFAERRVSEAALDMVRLSRRGRAEANAYGRAYLLKYSDTYDPPLGGIRLFRGEFSGCNANAWPAIEAEPGYRVDEVNMVKYQRDSSQVRATVAGMAGDVELCFEPSGGMRWRNGGGAFVNGNIGGINGGLIYNFTRFESGVQEGVVRQVAFPYGGDARIRR